MLTRWLCYLRLGLLDLIRLRSTTQHHAVIVAGICLPLLLLLGLKRGHVADLRKSLLTSPTGRQIIIGSSREGELLTNTSIERLEKELPGVEVIVPDDFRNVQVRVEAHDGKPAVSVDATLFSTRQRDPLLAHLGAVLPQRGEHAVVLRRGLADHLGVGPGDVIQTIVTRLSEGREETASVNLTVSSVIDTGKQDSRVGYVDVDLLNLFSTWVHGFRVEELGWPAGGSRTPAKYSSYLALCPRKKAFTDRDLKDLDFNYEVVEITDCFLDPDKCKGKNAEDLRTSLLALRRLLRPDRLGNLRVYQLTSRLAQERLDAPFRKDVYDPSTTTADEVLLPWNKPLQAQVDGKPWVLVGLTFRSRPWLEGYFRPEAVLTEIGENPFQARVLDAPAPVVQRSIQWPLKKDARLSLDVIPGASASSRAETLAVVPAPVVAWLTAYEEGSLTFDPVKRIFKSHPPTPFSTNARLYARTIDDVPILVEALRQRHFSISAEQARIMEIHKQDASLQLLVIVVGTGVFLFGVFTVVSVLHDSTDRKRGTIGILRVMGTSRQGIFLLIFIRATVIALLATAFCVLLGALLAWVLTWQPQAGSFWARWKPVIAVELHPGDCLTVLAGSLLCCTLGALWPAWYASRLDPFEAIVEGRFH